MKAFLVITAILACGVGRVAWAQHMYLDADGDGKATTADVLGRDQWVGIWVSTDRNRDGTLAALDHCSGRPLTINSYEFILRAENGEVEWGDYTNLQPTMSIPLGVLSSSEEYYNGYMGATALPPGTYKLGMLNVRVNSGIPSLTFAVTTKLWGAARTSFGSRCNGREADNTLKYGAQFEADGMNLGGDWMDATGLERASQGAASTASAPTFFRYEVSPNPANPRARLVIQTTRSGPLRVTMYDVAGRRVRTFMDSAHVPAGVHKIEVGDDEAGSIPSGVYFLRLEAVEASAVEKFVVLK